MSLISTTGYSVYLHKYNHTTPTRYMSPDMSQQQGNATPMTHSNPLKVSRNLPIGFLVVKISSSDWLILKHQIQQKEHVLKWCQSFMNYH